MEIESLTDNVKESILADHDMVARMISGYDNADPDLMVFNPDPRIVSQIEQLPENSAAILFLISCFIDSDYLFIPREDFWQKQLNCDEKAAIDALQNLEDLKFIKFFRTKMGIAIYPNPTVMFRINKSAMITAKYQLSDEMKDSMNEEDDFISVSDDDL